MSAMLGFDIVSGYDKNWLKDFSECVDLLVHIDFLFDFLDHMVTKVISFASVCIASQDLGPHA